MRHSEVRSLAKARQELDEDYDGILARSVDDSYNTPYSPNSSSEYMNESTASREHSLVAFFAPKKTQGKKNKNKDTNNQVTKVVEEDFSINEEKHVQQRGRFPSRDYADTVFDMEPEDDTQRTTINDGK